MFYPAVEISCGAFGDIAAGQGKSCRITVRMYHEERFLGCVSFAFDNETRKLKKGGGTGIVPFAHNDYFDKPSTQMGFAEEKYFKTK